MNISIILSLLFVCISCTGTKTSEGPTTPLIPKKEIAAPSTSQQVSGDKPEDNLVTTIASNLLTLLSKSKNIAIAATQTLWYSVKAMPEKYREVKNKQISG